MLAKEVAPVVRAVRLCPDEWKHALDIDYRDEPLRPLLEERLWQLGQEPLMLGQSAMPTSCGGGSRSATRSACRARPRSPVLTSNAGRSSSRHPDAAELALFDVPASERA